eukprot:Opistho-1_new@43934
MHTIGSEGPPCARWRGFATRVGAMYVEAPHVSQLTWESKKSFLHLIDKVEAVGCRSLVVLIERTREDREAVEKVFLYLGFSLVPASHEAAVACGDFDCMLFEIAP